MNRPELTGFFGGLRVGQHWHERRRSAAVCRVVTIDPALHVVDFEDLAGQIQQDTIEHFLSTHVAEAC
jgi:hypothetical protein